MSTSSSSNNERERVPQLGGNTGGTAYPQWRPLMVAYLMRQGIEARDYSKANPRWLELVAVVEADAAAEDEAAIALLLGAPVVTLPPGAQQTVKPDASSSSDSTVTDVKMETEAAVVVSVEQRAAKKNIAAMIGRSGKAFGMLWQALPAELRPLVADVPRGYAFGVWSFLEKKYRNTEQDSVAALWKTFTALSQESDETFDIYKARVDSVVELLVHAKQLIPTGLYASLMLFNLHSRYATAVLTLKTSSRVTDTDKINWPAIVEYMSQYERAQLGLGEAAEKEERAMVARTRPAGNPWKKVTQPSKSPSSQSPSSSGKKKSLSEIRCYNCQKMGHYASKCPSPRVDSSLSPRAPQSRGTEESHQSKQKSWLRSENSSEDETDRPSTKKPTERAHIMRTVNRYSALHGVKVKVKPSYASAVTHRSYGAFALAATAVSENKTPSAKLSSPASASVSEWKPIVSALSRAPKTPVKAQSLDEALKTSAKAIDTAATVSTTCNRETLHDMRRCKPMDIRMADGSTLSAVWKGELTMKLAVASKETFETVTIKDVYYHERFDANLLSWSVMKKAGWILHSEEACTYLITPKGTRVNADTRGGLTTIEDTAMERVYGVNTRAIVIMTAKEILQLHRRLNHASWGRMIDMSHIGATVGIGDTRGMSAAELVKAEGCVKNCSACLRAKAHKKALGHRGLDKGVRAGEVMHFDTFYAVTTDPLSGKKVTEYCALGVDGYSEFKYLEPKSSMADVAQSYVDMIEYSHTVTGRYPRMIVADLGSEFNNKTLLEFCRKRGIQYQPSPARAKELNGLAEKSVDTLKNHVRAMMMAAKMPENFGWKYAALHFVYTWNRTHLGQHTRVTPFQAMMGREASVLNLGEFGCDVFVHQDRSQRGTTFDQKAEPGIYLGHTGKQNCPIVRLLRSGKTVLSKDVHFREGSFAHLRAMTSGHIDDIDAFELSVVDDDVDNKDTPVDMDDLDQPPRPRAADEKKYPESEETLEAKKFDLESITAARVKNGVKEYCCRWVGYQEATWEPAATIKLDVPNAVQEYEAFVDGRIVAAQAAAKEAAQNRRASTRSASSGAKSVAFAATPPSAAAAALSSVLPPSESPAVDSDDESELDSPSAAAYAARCL